MGELTGRATAAASRADPVLLGLASLGFLVFGWFGAADFAPASGLAPSVGLAMAVSNALVVILETGSAVLGRRVVGLVGHGHPARRFWRVWSVASTLYAVSNVIDHLVPAPVSIGELCIGAGAAITVVVMLTYPLGVRSRRERVRLWLDMATVMAGAAGFGGYAVFSSLPGDRLPAGVVQVVTGPVVLLLLVFAVVKLSISAAAPFTRTTGLLGAAAATVGGVIQALRTELLSHGHERWYLAVALLSHMLAVATVRVQQRQFRTDRAVLDGRLRRPYSPLPYAAIVAVNGLLIFALNQDGVSPRSLAVLAATLGSSALVIVRQLSAFSDNTRLLSQLNAKVDELDRAKTMLQAAVDERDALTDQLRQLAYHDPLTGLANRTSFRDRIELTAARTRHGGGYFAVMLIDLDGFKPINDRHGHASGDAVLKDIAARLRASVRDTDTVARLGGDEFAVLLENTDPATVSEIATRIVATAHRPIDIGTAVVRVGASVGVAEARGEGVGVDELLEAADAAMYEVKRHGKGAYRTAAVTATVRS